MATCVAKSTLPPRSITLCSHLELVGYSNITMDGLYCVYYDVIDSSSTTHASRTLMLSSPSASEAKSALIRQGTISSSQNVVIVRIEKA